MVHKTLDSCEDSFEDRNMWHGHSLPILIGSYEGEENYIKG